MPVLGEAFPELHNITCSSFWAPATNDALSKHTFPNLVLILLCSALLSRLCPTNSRKDLNHFRSPTKA